MTLHRGPQLGSLSSIGAPALFISAELSHAHVQSVQQDLWNACPSSSVASFSTLCHALISYFSALVSQPAQPLQTALAKTCSWSNHHCWPSSLAASSQIHPDIALAATRCMPRQLLTSWQDCSPPLCTHSPSHLTAYVLLWS